MAASGMLLLCALAALAVLRSSMLSSAATHGRHHEVAPVASRLGHGHLRMLKDDCAACKSEYSKSSGVIADPGMLGGAMTFEDVQKALHSTCPEHCTRHKKKKSLMSSMLGGMSGFGDEDNFVGDDDDEDEDEEDDDTPCHNVERGDMCYDLVVYTVRKLLTNEEFYPGLSKTSTEAQVQNRLHRDRPGICPRPCPKGTKDGDTTAPSEKKPFKSDGDDDAGDDDEDDLEVPDVTAAGCETAEKGDPCYDTILWVLKEGVFAHPKWFQGLNQASSMEEVQLHLHKSPPKGMPVTCPTPCEEECRTTKEGEPCYNGVSWAMEEGIANHSAWFVGLNEKSSFEEVQMNIHNNPNATVHCPKPCNVCHTAVEGERCYSAVMWVLSDGIKKFPGSYPGLTELSSFQAVQFHLYQNKSESKSRCVEPCPVAVEE